MNLFVFTHLMKFYFLTYFSKFLFEDYDKKKKKVWRIDEPIQSQWDCKLRRCLINSLQLINWLGKQKNAKTTIIGRLVAELFRSTCIPSSHCVAWLRSLRKNNQLMPTWIGAYISFKLYNLNNISYTFTDTILRYQS